MHSRKLLRNVLRYSQLKSRHFSKTCSLKTEDKELENEMKNVKKAMEDNNLPNMDVMDEFAKLPKFEPPIQRTVRILSRDVQTVKKTVQKLVGEKVEPLPDIFPNHVDVLIIGGGGMGSSIAYWLKQRCRDAFRLAVVERDMSYSEASTTLSVGGLRQQFSLPESIEMSLFGAEFIRNIPKLLAVDGFDPPDPQFQPYGYLFLASEQGAQTLQENSKLQNELGAKNILLTGKQLKERFPWLNVDKVAVGCLGLEKEGWFDPWSLLNGLKQKAISLGAEYICGDVVGFEFDRNKDIYTYDNKRLEYLEKAIIKLPDGTFQTIKFCKCIIAAGAWSGLIAKMAKIGLENGLRSVPLPIEPRKRFVYNFHCPNGPGINTPLTVEPGGTYFRREGLRGNYIGGCSPLESEEPSCDNLDVDYDYFEEKVWPVLAHRVPAFENAKLRSAWAGFYEYNTVDANGVIGIHPYYNNLLFASGFSGHGIQHVPAVGRAIMELVLDDGFKTLDLSRLSFERFLNQEPLLERNIW